VIADVVMPGMSGFELCQMLKLRESTKAVPVILISGIINESVVAQAQEAGAFDVVSKPFTPDDLFPKIERALNAAKQMVSASSDLIPAAPVAPAPAPVASVTAPTAFIAAPKPADPPLSAAPASVSPPTPMAGGVHTQLIEALRPFLDKPEIESALVIGHTGQLLAWVGQTMDEPDLLATYLHTILSISSVMGEKYHLSPIQSLSLEYLGKTLMVNRISEKSSLVLLVRGTGGTGVIRYLVQKQTPQLKAVLGD
jgi:predicted regulator of Ras-like GTPase activity (Roadblock/LC7/MglB family)